MGEVAGRGSGVRDGVGGGGGGGGSGMRDGVGWGRWRGVGPG